MRKDGGGGGGPGYTEAFKEYWKTLGRPDKTKLINSGIVKDKSGKLTNLVMEKYQLVEEIKKKKTKEFEHRNESFILEQAEQMVGGPERLRQALARGAVVMREQGGIQMYTFPSTRLSMLDGVSHESNSRAEVVSWDFIFYWGGGWLAGITQSSSIKSSTLHDKSVNHGSRSS